MRQIGLLVLALFLAVCASGPVNALSRHMGRGFAILLVHLGIILIPCAIIAILVPPVGRDRASPRATSRTTSSSSPAARSERFAY